MAAFAVPAEEPAYEDAVAPSLATTTCRRRLSTRRSSATDDGGHWTRLTDFSRWPPLLRLLARSTSARFDTRVAADRPHISEVEAVVRVVAAAAVAAYAVGLFTANAYLNRIGVADFAQLRARFIFTGAIVVLAFATAFIPVQGLWLHARRASSPRLNVGDGYRWLAAIYVLASTLAWFVIVSLPKRLDDDAGWGLSEARHAALLETGALLAGWTGLLLARSGWGRRIGGHDRPRGRGDDDPDSEPTNMKQERGETGTVVIPIRLMGILVGLVFGGALFISQFGRHVYPRIPTPYGGGKAVCARIAFADGAESQLNDLQLPVEARVTQAVPIAYEADTFLVIGLGNDRWVRVRIDSIDAVQLLPDRSRCTPS